MATQAGTLELLARELGQALSALEQRLSQGNAEEFIGRTRHSATDNCSPQMANSPAQSVRLFQPRRRLDRSLST